MAVRALVAFLNSSLNFLRSHPTIRLLQINFQNFGWHSPTDMTTSRVVVTTVQ